MTTYEFKKYWMYYLILENDVRKIEPFISFHKDNFHCFSNEFIKLHQIICSEIDVMCKDFCKNENKRSKTIKDYTEVICKQFPMISEQKNCCIWG